MRNPLCGAFYDTAGLVPSKMSVSLEKKYKGKGGWYNSKVKGIKTKYNARYLICSWIFKKALKDILRAHGDI